MKKILCLILSTLMIISSAIPAFAATYKRSANVSNEAEQYAKAAEEWINSYGSWITGDDIYFTRFGGKFMEHAVEVDKEKKTIKTSAGKTYDLNSDGLLRDWSGTLFFKKAEESDTGSVWTTIKWPKIVIDRERKEGSDENGQYYYYEYKYSFEEDF